MSKAIKEMTAKAKKPKKPVPYVTVAIRTEDFYDIYRVREKFAEDFVKWFSETRKGRQWAWVTAYTALEGMPKLPKEIIRSYLLHRCL